jgi:hypothetical protein
VVRVVAAGGNIGDPEEGTKGIIVQTVGGKEVLVLLVTGTSPEVANLLGLDVAGLEGRAIKGSGGNLQDGQGRDNVVQGLGDSWDVRNQRGQRDRERRPEGGEWDQLDQRGLHLEVVWRGPMND